MKRCCRAAGPLIGGSISHSEVRMAEETKLEKIARVSGKATSKGLDALARHGFDLRGKLSAPINQVPRRTPPPEKPKSDN